jgi:hypothetical protein
MCVVAAALALTTSAAGGADVSGSVIGAGKLRGIYWAVEAFPDGNRKGICFGLAYGNRIRPNGESVECAAPAEKRGMFHALESDHRHSPHSAITVVGMALNSAVARVDVTTCSGQIETLHPKKPHGPGSRRGRIADYRYLAFAVRGTWCTEAITTYDKAGEVLFEDAE